MEEPRIEQSWVEELKRSNDLTAQLIRTRTDWKLILRNALLSGLGGAIGATVLVSFLVWILQPLKQLEVFKPTLDRIAQQLERDGRR